MSVPRRDLQPSWQTATFGFQNGLEETIPHEQPHMDNSETYPSSSNGLNSMLQRPDGDSGFYDNTLFGIDSNSTSETHIQESFQPPHHQQDPTPLGSSFGKTPSWIQGSVSDLLAKWDKWLHDWYINSGRKMPNENQLLFLCASIGAPMHAVKARFQQYYELDNYSSDSLLYSSTSSQELMAPPEAFEPTFPAFENLPTVSLGTPTRLVELTANEQTTQTSLTEDSELPVNAVPRPSRVRANAISGASIVSTGPDPRSDRVRLTPKLISLILELARTRRTTGCGSRTSREGSGKYQCTIKCRGHFKSAHDWIRHENIIYQQSLWFCTRCGDLDNATEDDLHYREDKFRRHMRQAHPGWVEQGGLGDCKVPRIPSVPFPRRCGFCDRNRFCAHDWTHRCKHIAMHFKAGATMDQWRDWPEDEPEDDDAEPDESGSDDDDQDDDGDDGGDSDNGDTHQPHGSSPPPDTDKNQDPGRFSGNSPGEWSPTLGEYLNPWGSQFQDFSSLVIVSPLQDQRETASKSQPSTQWMLPILSQERINLKGGTASVYKIEVPSSHVPWTSNGEGDTITSGSQMFAVKTYQKEYLQIYDREIAAFARLNRHGESHQNILKCFGFFIQCDRTGTPNYNLLLEYADCDLEEYFADASPPASPMETMLLWKQLSGVVHGLQAIHDGFAIDAHDTASFGVHADLKPANILRVKNQWKIADFGFSKFVRPDEVGMDKHIMNGGTPTYSPPECHLVRSPSYSRAYDAWSLGCIFLEMGTWCVSGFRGIRELESRRKGSITTSDTGTETNRSVPPFHNGKKLLPEVARWHEVLQRSNPPGHGITGDMLDLVIAHLLQGDPRSRIDSKELCERVGEVISKAEQRRLYAPATLQWQINTKTNFEMSGGTKGILHDNDKNFQLGTTNQLRTSSPVVLPGLYGTWKTLITREYVYSHQRSYSHSFWVEVGLPQDLHSNAQVDMVPEPTSTTTCSFQDSYNRRQANRSLKGRRSSTESILGHYKHNFFPDRPLQLNHSSCGCNRTRCEDDLESLGPFTEVSNTLMDWTLSSMGTKATVVHEGGGDESSAQSRLFCLSQVMDQYLSGRQEKSKSVIIATDGIWSSGQTEAMKQLLTEFRHSRRRRRHHKPGKFMIEFDYTGNDVAGLKQLLLLEVCFPDFVRVYAPSTTMPKPLSTANDCSGQTMGLHHCGLVTDSRRTFDEDNLLPSHCFDHVHGTSTGGLKAVTLGVVRMSVAQYLEAYQHIGDDPFHHRHSILPHVYDIFKRRNGNGSNHCKVPSRTLPQWFRPECPPGEWSNGPDVKNQGSNKYEVFFTFGFRRETWDHHVAGPRQLGLNGHVESAFHDGGYDFNASGLNMFPDLRSEVSDRAVSCSCLLVSVGTGNRYRRLHGDSMLRHLRRVHFKPARRWCCEHYPRQGAGPRLNRVSKYKHWEHRHQRRYRGLADLDHAMTRPLSQLSSIKR